MNIIGQRAEKRVIFFNNKNAISYRKSTKYTQDTQLGKNRAREKVVSGVRNPKW